VHCKERFYGLHNAFHKANLSIIAQANLIWNMILELSATKRQPANPSPERIVQSVTVLHITAKPIHFCLQHLLNQVRRQYFTRKGKSTLVIISLRLYGADFDQLRASIERLSRTSLVSAKMSVNVVDGSIDYPLLHVKDTHLESNHPLHLARPRRL